MFCCSAVAACVSQRTALCKLCARAAAPAAPSAGHPGRFGRWTGACDAEEAADFADAALLKKHRKNMMADQRSVDDRTPFPLLVLDVDRDLERPLRQNKCNTDCAMLRNRSLAPSHAACLRADSKEQRNDIVTKESYVTGSTLWREISLLKFPQESYVHRFRRTVEQDAGIDFQHDNQHGRAYMLLSI